MERARYDLGRFWPPLKIYSNVAFSVGHYLQKTQLKNEHVLSIKIILIDTFSSTPFWFKRYIIKFLQLFTYYCHLLITFANSLDPDQARQNGGPYLNPNCLTLVVFLKEFF